MNSLMRRLEKLDDGGRADGKAMLALLTHDEVKSLRDMLRQSLDRCSQGGSQESEPQDSRHFSHLDKSEAILSFVKQWRATH